MYSKMASTVPPTIPAKSPSQAQVVPHTHPQAPLPQPAKDNIPHYDRGFLKPSWSPKVVHRNIPKFSYLLCVRSDDAYDHSVMFMTHPPIRVHACPCKPNPQPPTMRMCPCLISQPSLIHLHLIKTAASTIRIKPSHANGTQPMLYIGTPVHWYIGTPVHWYANALRRYIGTLVPNQCFTSVHRYTGTPVHWYTGTPVHWYANALHRYIGTLVPNQCLTSVHRYTGTSVHWYTGTLARQ